MRLEFLWLGALAGTFKCFDHECGGQVCKALRGIERDVLLIVEHALYYFFTN